MLKLSFNKFFTRSILKILNFIPNSILLKSSFKNRDTDLNSFKTWTYCYYFCKIRAKTQYPQFILTMCREEKKRKKKKKNSYVLTLNGSSLMLWTLLVWSMAAYKCASIWKLNTCKRESLRTITKSCSSLATRLFTSWSTLIVHKIIVIDQLKLTFKKRIMDKKYFTKC